MTRFLMLDVKTKRNLSRHKSSCRDTNNWKRANVLSQHRYLMSRQEIKEQYRKITATYQFMLQHNEEKRAESMSLHNFSYRDTDYCNLESLLRHYKKKFNCYKGMNFATLKYKVSGPDRETKSR